MCMNMDNVFNCTAYGKLGRFCRYSFYSTNLLAIVSFLHELLLIQKFMAIVHLITVYLRWCHCIWIVGNMREENIFIIV